MSDETPLRALTMRIAGADYDGIAGQLKITRKQAEAHVDSELEKLLRPDENAGLLDLARLDSMLMALWPKVRDGDVKAAEIAWRVMERKNALTATLGAQEESELDRVRRARAERLGQ